MHEPSNTNDRVTASPAGKTNRRRAITISVLFHLALIVALWFWYVPTTKPTGDNGLASTGASDASGGDELAPPTAPPPPPVAQPEIPPDQIQASLESQIRSAEALPDEQKLSELEKNLSRLERIATEESVREVTDTIANSLGLDAGPVPMDEPPVGAFDPETAQIHDVTRARSESGNWEYTSVLVDAQGRTQSVPLTAAEGESAYRTFEQLKQYPMAEGIYRQLVMPMIQKMIQASEFSEEATRAAERLQRESDQPSAGEDPSK